MQKKTWKIIMYVYMIIPIILTLAVLTKFVFYIIGYISDDFLGASAGLFGSLLASIGVFGWLPYKMFFEKRAGKIWFPKTHHKI